MYGKIGSLFISSIFILVSSLSAQGSNSGKITGSVTDRSTNRAIEFVNVVLRSRQDSVIITGKVSDQQGKFEIANVPAGEYFVTFSLIGYKEKSTRPFLIDSLRKHLNLGAIELIQTAVSLDEVLVEADKSIFNNSIDRKVYNVDQDMMSKAGSASELLQNVPSVQVDIDGNVTLRGSSNVLIMVNGKTSALMDKSSAEVLQQMPASSIEKVELITNPSAKYKPDGTSGIINIVLKKNTEPGMNGNLSVNGGNNDRYNGNIRLNLNPGEYNFYASYGIRKDNRNRATTDARLQVDPPSATTRYAEDLASSAHPLSHIGSAGLEYRLSQYDQMGISGDYFYNSFTRTDNANVDISNAAGSPVERYIRNRYDPEYEKEYSATAFFQHDFPKEDHKVRLEFTTSQSPEVEDNHYTTLYLLPRPVASYDNNRLQQEEGRSQLSVEYENPLSESSSLETGYAGEFDNNDIDNHIEYYNPGTLRFVSDSLKTNRFLYNASIHAFYGTFKHSFGAFGFSAGLRTEQAYTKSNLVTRDSIVPNDYFSLYPTLHLSYKVSPFAEMQLSYSKRTHRPHEHELNPFPEYRDPRNISVGNPALVPEYIHSLELGCQLQTEIFSFLPALFYRYTYNRFTSVTKIVSDTVLLTTSHNLSNDQSGGFEMVISANAGEFFTAHWSANAFYERLDATNLGYTEKRSTTTWSSNVTVNLNFTESSRMQVNSSFNSSRLTPQGEYVPTYVVNAGFKQELLGGRISLLATVSDLFKSQKRQLELNTPLLNQTVVNTRDSRIVYLGLTYHLGSPPKRSREEQMRYENGE